jgi:hypothetical protein
MWKNIKTFAVKIKSNRIFMFSLSSVKLYYLLINLFIYLTVTEKL